jgi:hypothetical protein
MHRESGFRLAGLVPLLAAALAACAPKPEPRTVSDFMDDGLAREGVLSRCNQNREETQSDAECINARRAAATLEQQSDATVLALRDREAGQAAHASSSSAFGSVLPTVRTLEVEVEPPANDLVIAAPPLEVPEIAVVPRPFRDERAQQ